MTAGILIRDKFGQDIFGTNTYLLNKPLALRAGHSCEVEFRMAMDIGPGKYTLTAAIHTGETHGSRCFHWHDQITDFEIAGTLGERFTGLCKLRPEVSIAENREYA
jgi:lipopolysaccharide transport system ATP-binding protein